MADKFLNLGSGSANLGNGSVNIFAASLGSVNLDPSAPLKTNSVRQIVSEKLDIADINNLSNELSIKDELTFIEDDVHSTPAGGRVKLYVKTDGNFYKKDDTGTESGFGGGGGITTTNAPVVDNSLVVYDGTTGNTVKYVADLRYDAINNTLEVNDLETSNYFSVNDELQKVSNITSATQGTPNITVFDGEIDVKVIKSASHNVELEFDNTNANLTADGDITLLTATGDIELNGNSISLSGPSVNYNGVNIDFWRKFGTATLENFFIGNLAGNATTADSNIGIGNSTLEINQTGGDNIGIGTGAGKNVFNCSQNIAIGGGSGFYKSGVNCFNNVAIGIQSQQGASGLTNGENNNSLGATSLYSLTTGSFNTCIGTNSGFTLTTGTDNTFVGAYCGDSNTDDVGNTAVGRNALTNGGTNRTALGKQAETDADNQVCIGNSAITEIRNLGDNTCDLGSALHQFKDLYIGGTIKGMPYDFSFACSNEISTITTTGIKMTVRIPRNFQTTKVKLSVNAIGGTSFTVQLQKNGSVLLTELGLASALVVDNNLVHSFVEDDIIQISVGNPGAGTAVGLKVYMIGKIN